MMRVDPCDEDQSINIVISSMTTGTDKGKQPEEDGWVDKVPEKEYVFNLNCSKETFMEEKKSFAEASTLGSQEKTPETSAT